MARGFTHLDYEQRLKIEKMLDEGVSKYRIADELGMDPSSIYREIKRGLRDGRYDPDYSNLWIPPTHWSIACAATMT